MFIGSIIMILLHICWMIPICMIYGVFIDYPDSEVFTLCYNIGRTTYFCFGLFVTLTIFSMIRNKI